MVAGSCGRALRFPVDFCSPKEGASGYGTYENTIAALEKALSPGPFILGERFSAADVLLSSEITWGTLVKALEPRPVFDEYRRRCSERDAFRRAFAGFGG